MHYISGSKDVSVSLCMHLWLVTGVQRAGRDVTALTKLQKHGRSKETQLGQQQWQPIATPTHMHMNTQHYLLHALATFISSNIRVTPHNYAAFQTCAKCNTIYKINYDLDSCRKISLPCDCFFPTEKSEKSTRNDCVNLQARGIIASNETQRRGVLPRPHWMPRTSSFELQMVVGSMLGCEIPAAPSGMWAPAQTLTCTHW